MGLVPTGVIDGVLIGLVALVVSLMARFTVQRSPLPLGGGLAVAASVAAVAGPPTVGGGLASAAGLAAGAVVAGAGGQLGGRLELALHLRTLAVVPGAILAVLTLDPSGPTWTVLAAVGSASVLGASGELVEEGFEDGGVLMAMVGVSAVGILVTLPETRLIAPVAGALVVLATLGWPLGLVRLGRGGPSAVVVILSAIVADGSAIRPGGIVGGLAAPGLLAVLAWPRAQARREFDDGAVVAVQLLVLHAVVTLGVARVAGLNDRAGVALVQAAVILSAGLSVADRILTSRGPDLGVDRSRKPGPTEP